ncbi:tetratricopeptide (TPR) repeat protein [Pararhizobium capsulatum DSM 1112]|uniref:Tetratricopeptide (TPR) repeat protein n=1 Tax=Pararhizobium capsulatum DSM 1112 TaxID=1121113 RepID=A0ABU0BWH7_9HYPH|nr:porin family protein [Pararhizobium capsulatum]MDQ0322616.1 tetratricopeptide (TPR) repeat protein [Pararhizobium capsulatum DSM 1112]
MRYPIRNIVLFSTVFTALALGTASAQEVTGKSTVTPRPVSASLSSIEAERARLFEQMLADPSNLDVAFRYAALSSEAGDLEAAISTLERMLIYAPGLPRLQLELGVLYFRLSAYDMARTYFNAALAAPAVPEEVRTKIDTYIAAIDARSSDSQFSGSFSTGIRWQSNATAATDARSIETTFFPDPLVLNDSARGDGDFNAYAALNLRYSYDLASQGDKIEATFQSYGTLQAEHTEINTGYAELQVGPRFNLERFGLDDTSLAVYGIAGGYYIDSDSYLYSGGVGAALITDLSITTRLVFGNEYRREAFQDSFDRPTASDRTGDRYRSSLTLQHFLSGNVALWASLLADRRLADVSYLSYQEFGLNVGLSIDMDSPIATQADPWTLGFALGYANRNYDSPDPTYSLDTEQEDNEAYAELSLLVPFKENWEFQTVLGYRNVNSNYDIYSYDNMSASLGVVRRF